MATRGAIARLTHVLPPKFAGRYHHWDSCPTELGRTLWELYHSHFQRDLDAMLRVLLDEHPAGWSSINGADFSIAPGVFDLSDEATRQDGCPPICYCHGDRQEEGWQVTDENASASGCEWAYVFTYSLSHDGTRHDTMMVLSSYTRTGSKMIGMFGQGDPQAVWAVVTVVDLQGQEPDWEQIAQAAPLDPLFDHAAYRRGANAGAKANHAPIVHRDEGRQGIYVVRLPQEAPHYVGFVTGENGQPQVFCTCSKDEEAESPECQHAQAALKHRQEHRAAARARQVRGLEYSGSRVRIGEGQEQVLVIAWEAGWPRLLDPRPSQRLHNHSPAGFEWSYGGSGPAQLALAILFDFSGDEELALTHYQAFKSAIIAAMPHDLDWRITGNDIEKFLASRQLN